AFLERGVLDQVGGGLDDELLRLLIARSGDVGPASLSDDSRGRLFRLRVGTEQRGQEKGEAEHAGPPVQMASLPTAILSHGGLVDECCHTEVAHPARTGAGRRASVFSAAGPFIRRENRKQR